MQLFTQHPLGFRALALFLSIGIGGFFIHTSYSSDTAPVLEKKIETTHFLPTNETSFGFGVSGVVEAGDAITVRAQTAGVVTTLVHEEGDIVAIGDTLLVQEVPLLGSRMALQDAQNALALLGQDASVNAQTGARESARVSQESASSSASLLGLSARTTQENSAALLATQMYGSITTLVAALDFIDAQKTYFSSTGLTAFRKTVDTLYGSSRSYLSGAVQYSFHSHNDILAFLDNTTEDTLYPDTATLVGVAELLDKELDATRGVFVDGESEFLDAKKLSQDSTLYATYLTQRGAIIETQANLRALIGAARSAKIGESLQVLDATTQNILGGIGFTTAQYAQENAVRTYAQTDRVGGAARSVLGAEGALGTPRAPFAGVVGEVFIHEGEFVSPGTPLMTLVGTGAQELVVTVPHEMLPLLKTGLSFTDEGTVVGYVSRFAPVVVRGGVVVTIELQKSYLVGDVLRGDIRFETGTNSMLFVPRSYLFFDTAGVYVRTVSGKEIRVRIIYDAGKTVGVEPADECTEQLVPATGITL